MVVALAYVRRMGELIRTARFGGAGRVVVEPWITKGDLAASLSFSTRTVDRWILAGMPKDQAWRQIGGRRRFMRSEVETWLRVTFP